MKHKANLNLETSRGTSSWDAHRGDKGFSIVELLIVIVVIAILATVTVVAFRGVQQRAALAVLQSDSSTFAKKLELFRVDAGQFPTAIDDCPVPSATNLCITPNAATTVSYFAFNPSVPPSFLAGDTQHESACVRNYR